jgi:hypothetical protein
MEEKKWEKGKKIAPEMFCFIARGAINAIICDTNLQSGILESISDTNLHIGI